MLPQDDPTKRLLTEANANATFRKPNEFVEGAPLYSMGHSYTMYPYPYATKMNGEYFARVKSRLRMGDLWAKGRSSTFAIDNFGRLISNVYDTGKGVWTPNSKGVCIIQNAMNELGDSAASNPVFREMWATGIRSQIATMSSRRVLAFTDATATVGTWTKHGVTEGTKGVKGEIYFSATTGAEVQWTVTGDEVWIIAVAADTYAAAPWAVKVNGTTLLTGTTQGKKTGYVDKVTGVVHTYTPVAYKVTGLNAAAGTTGEKTVVFTRNATSGNVFVAGLIETSPNPPVIFLAKEPPRAGSGAPTYTANIGAFNEMTDTIAAEFPNVYAVDFAPGWDNTRMISSLDVAGGSFHPNDIGHALMATHLENAINANITGWRDGVAIL